jgi:HD-GYP domain-containing protein (c-di-GMP phosphodiesterase class II)
MPIFARMSQDELQRILKYMDRKVYPGGVVIIEENTPGNAFYVILRGSVEITKRLEDHKEIALSVLQAGHFFGEMALLEEGMRSATVRTLESTEVLELTRHDFMGLVQDTPLLTYGLLKELSARLRLLDTRMIADSAQQDSQLRQAYLNTVSVVANAIEARDPYTGGHTERVSVMAQGIGMRMGMTEVEELAALGVGALLHDVGKIGVPDAILSKPTHLSEAEYEMMKTHTMIGTRMLQDIYFLEQAIPIVRHHHERFDGKGYPDKLVGDAIPLGARIIAVVDAFDAMITTRPYRVGMLPEAALEELQRGAGTQFDPKVIAVFNRAWQEGAVKEWLDTGAK